MKVYTTHVYQCEYCSSKYTTAEEAFQCELECLKLSKEEFDMWAELKYSAQKFGAAVYITRNDETIKAFDDAVEKLVEFEEKHGITGVR